MDFEFTALKRVVKSRVAIRMCLCLSVLLFTGVVLAQELAIVKFEQPEDVVLVWAKRMGLLMTVAALALIMYVLVCRRNRLGDYQSKWLMFFGLCVLPVPVLFLSNGVGLEQSKDIAFCESCHVMDPILSNMRDLESETLAARHYRYRLIQKEQCWSCHSDYGVFGTLEAKINGLNEVYRYFTGTYELPIKMRHPYNFRICLNCHAASVLFQEEEAHTDVIEGALSGEIKCTDCHEMAHPEREMRTTP